MTIYDGERPPIFLEEDGGWKKRERKAKQWKREKFTR